MCTQLFVGHEIVTVGAQCPSVLSGFMAVVPKDPAGLRILGTSLGSSTVGGSVMANLKLSAAPGEW